MQPEGYTRSLDYSVRRQLTPRTVLAGCLVAMVVTSPAVLSARSVLEGGNATVWRYVDDGKEPDAAWRSAEFDDSRWKSGRAPLGYGDPGLGTEVGWGADESQKFITTWFRHVFERPELKPGERLVVSVCVDDGAAIYLNGRELGRINLPRGPLTAHTRAPRALADRDEGFYLRMPVPLQTLRPGRNVLAVEVRQCSADSSDLFFDLALKTLPPESPAPVVPAAARAVVQTYLRQHYVGPGVSIPDGYLDGGRRMQLDAEDRATSDREILRVDRASDAELVPALVLARAPELRALPPLERAQRLAKWIDRASTPPGGRRWEEWTCEQLQREWTNQSLLLGDWLDQCHAGVCRHRSLLFKILADEAGLKAALVRGNYASPAPSAVRTPHAWNEIVLDDGRRLLVDVMLHRGRQSFPEVTAREVTERYLRVDNTPWYGTSAQP